VQKEIRSLNADLPVYDVRSMRRAMDGGNGFFLINMGALFGGALGVLGLVLALVGLYGVVSYSASQRTQEIGVRIALGAAPSRVLASIVRDGLWLVLYGTLIGLPLIAIGGRLASGLVFGVSPYDPLTLVAAVLVLLIVGVTASAGPARRASRVDPMVALRQE